MKNAPTRRFGLSKSKIAAFEQCPRRLWQQVHAPERAEVDDSAKARFATGHSVGELACSQCHGGVMVEAEPDLRAALKTTRQLLDDGHNGPIFEATFEHDGILVRVDILEHAGRKGWRMVEVKSAGKVKEVYHGDLATQTWVLREAGVPLAGAAIRHIDTAFTLKAENEFDGLFKDAELLAAIDQTARERSQVVQAARDMLAGEEPQIDPGPHCSTPFDCEFAEWCWKDAPEGPEWPVEILHHTSARKWRERGLDDLLELDEKQLTGKGPRILAATRDDVPFHDARGARTAIAEWGWPRVWLDFETINFAIPRWIGTRPFQQVPFQFSLHLQARNGRISHREFLDTSGNDPREACAKALIDAIPADATIIAYNASFEIGVLNDLANALPRYAKRLRAMAARTVDLLPIAKEYWYHRDQRGSWSIKAVLPTLGGESYAALEVKDGSEAQQAWLEAIDPDTDPTRRWVLEEGLKAYCRRDTEAMMVVARGLAGKAAPA